MNCSREEKEFDVELMGVENEGICEGQFSIHRSDRKGEGVD